MILVCDWLPPEFGAVGQFMLARARDAAAGGAHVVMIGLGKESSREIVKLSSGELHIVRLQASRNPKESFFRRAFWALVTNARLARTVASAQSKLATCTILVTGSPPLLSYWLLLQNLLFWRRQIVYRITDFYPEVAFAAGKMRWLKPAKPLFNWLRRAAYRIEVLGLDQARRLQDSKLLPSRISLVRDSSIVSDWHIEKPFQRPFGDEYRVLLYSGNMGIAHETATICEAYRRHVLSGSNRVRLWINGTGLRIESVREYCREHALPLAVSPPAPLEQLASVLQAADAHLVLLDERFWGYVLPSKIYSCLEAGQPLLYVGPTESDVHLLASRHARFYWQVQGGDIDGCFQAIEALGALDGQASDGPRRIDFNRADLAPSTETPE